MYFLRERGEVTNGVKSNSVEHSRLRFLAAYALEACRAERVRQVLADHVNPRGLLEPHPLSSMDAQFLLNLLSQGVNLPHIWDAREDQWYSWAKSEIGVPRGRILKSNVEGPRIVERNSPRIAQVGKRDYAVNGALAS